MKSQVFHTVRCHVSGEAVDSENLKLIALGSERVNESWWFPQDPYGLVVLQSKAVWFSIPTVKAGLHVRRKHEHKRKHKPCVNREDASTSTRKRNARSCLCLRRPVHTWLTLN